MDILSSQNKRISQLSDFLCEAMDLLNNPRMIPKYFLDLFLLVNTT